MIAMLDVLLGPTQVGTIALLPERKSLFVFDEAYTRKPERPVLSQSYFDAAGELRQETRSTRVKLPAWFSNLLPEGRLREYLAQLGGIHVTHEFELLRLLGEDLPGAVRVIAHSDSARQTFEAPRREAITGDAPLPFSLAGVQLKFSALVNHHGGLTIPASGIGGDWIVKLPSPNYPAVPENEAAMLSLAAAVGIAVPEHRLVPLAAIEGLPELGPFAGSKALAVKRFDREGENRIHIEDFAQVFGVFPDEKYEKVGFARIAEMIAIVMGQEAAQEFVARLVFTILTGNGDMHLKNWSLIYRDGRTPNLSPAYDLVSTVPYIPKDGLALNFLGKKEFAAVTRERFKRFAQKASLSENETASTVSRIIDSVKSAWGEQRRNSEVPPEIADRIENHILRMLVA